jgi:hypothetical protein
LPLLIFPIFTLRVAIRWWVVLLLAIGCAGPGKREAAGLAEAVDRYRRAENAGKAGQAEAVVSFACTDAEVCATKQACLAAISPTVRALGLKDEVAARLSDIEGKRVAADSAEAQGLPQKLDEAERLLREGHAKMGACESSLAALRLSKGL